MGLKSIKTGAKKDGLDGGILGMMRSAYILAHLLPLGLGGCSHALVGFRAESYGEFCEQCDTKGEGRRRGKYKRGSTTDIAKN